MLTLFHTTLGELEWQCIRQTDYITNTTDSCEERVNRKTTEYIPDINNNNNKDVIMMIQ